MKIKKLRLLGFKSFVEPTELLIEPGLTGVVGPNGCGKSNLLEALRWVMGEASHKSMRAASMDDVIFSGSQNRPSRNAAEVTIVLDNAARKAPAEFNGSDVIEINRRIERDQGSAYRINGKEARARDVKILFEDAATGARSPALVRQGQIGEIVNAKPEQRRRILEDAAGIAGLHSRRHEAELRLRAAEANLARLADVLGQINAQLDGLKRQARQAKRYKELSEEIRRGEAVLLHLSWTAAAAEVVAAEALMAEATAALGLSTQAEAAARIAEAAASERIGPLRDAEATRGAVLARLKIGQETFEREAERQAQRQKELLARLAQLERDVAREQGLIAEAKDSLVRLDSEIGAAAGEGEGSEAAQQAAATQEVQAAQVALAESERQLGLLTAAEADDRARRRQLEAALAEHRATGERMRIELAEALDAQKKLLLQSSGSAKLAVLSPLVERLTEEVESCDEMLIAAEEATLAAGETARLAREAHATTNLQSSQLGTEIATLTKLLRPAAGKSWPPIVDTLQVTAGYETALGAALGDDLEAPASEAAPQHWRKLGVGDLDAPLPEGAVPLLEFIRGAAELTRRLRQVGVVDRTIGKALQARLAQGQRLVSPEGDLWRWDGFTSAANAPSAAARRLAEKNRLIKLEARQELALEVAEAAETRASAAADKLRGAEAETRRLRGVLRELQAKLQTARQELGIAERIEHENAHRGTALADSEQRARKAVADAETKVAATTTALTALAPADQLAARLAASQAAAAADRNTYAEARAALATLEQARRLRSERLAEAARERSGWQQRMAGAHEQIATLQARMEGSREELDALEDLPLKIAGQRQRLMNEIAAAERQRQTAADELERAEARLRETAQTLRAAQAAVADHRESKARSEAQLEAARARLFDEARQIEERLGVAPTACLAFAGVPPDQELPSPAELARTLERLKSDRDRLGGVNLQAEDELAQISLTFQSMDSERADLEAAIGKLRNAITQLNREGRKRLNDAFEVVNGHFKRLFGVLFSGGEAELQLVEGEDPLESGLEIFARPPGKKPATLSLLSGGEQTLTALSLIFAVFLTNPSPICVLDEVDAPLDDANVDRFCTMMERMAEETDTRFLVITHHPMTMTRMNRLFGVTMAERGVSQLVSVDLATAERFLEAG